MTGLDLAIVVAFLGGLVVVATWLARRQRQLDDYYLGGRRLPAWALGLSLAANQVSAISLVGAPAFVAVRAGGGLVWLQYELAVPLALAVLAVWAVPLLRRAVGAEVYQAVEERLGPGARRTLALLFLGGRGLGAGVILLASARVVSACSGWDVGLSLAVVGGVALVYTALGGLAADVVSDVLQLVLLWGGTVVAVVVLAFQPAVWNAVTTAVAADRLRPFDLSGHGLGDGATFGLWPMLIGGFFLYLSYYGCDQTQAQRILAASDDRAARTALTMAAVVRFPLVMTYCLLGVMLAGLLEVDAGFAAAVAAGPADALVPEFLVRYLPVGILGVVVAGILAAALSSVDSALNSLSAVTAEHLVQGGRRGRRRVVAARALTVVWGLVAVGAGAVFATSGETVIELVNRVGSAIYGPVLGVFVAAWRSRRADGRSAVAGAVAGVAANLGLAAVAPAVSWLWWNPFGFAVTLAVAVAAGRQDRPVVRIPVDGGRKAGLILAVTFVVIVAALVAIQLAAT